MALPAGKAPLRVLLMPDPASQLAAATSTPADAPARVPHGQRASRAAHGMLGAVGAVIVHGLLLMALAAVVWRTASTPAPPGPEIKIDFEATMLGDAPEPVAGTSAPAAPPRPAAPEVQLVMMPESEPAPAPVALPPLASLATTPLTSQPPTGVVDSASVMDAPEFAPAPAGGPAPFPAAFDPNATSIPGGVRFAGLGASNAKTIVYAIDASGSMVTSLPFVIAEVERSIAGLSLTQKFGVVLFRKTSASGGSATEVFSPVLVRATPSARQRLHDWLAHVAPAGRSVPLAGLERALEYKPDAVFLLSRSIERSGGNVWERGLVRTLTRVNELNPDLGGGRRPTVIQTIQFLDDDPTGVMQEIGRQHGSRTDAAGRLIAGYRVIRRGEELEAGNGSGAGSGGAK